jgi:hypothetical protein
VLGCTNQDSAATRKSIDCHCIRFCAAGAENDVRRLSADACGDRGTGIFENLSRVPASYVNAGGITSALKRRCNSRF